MTERKSTEKSVEADNAEVQAKVDEAEDKGYFGQVFDPNPNSAYSLQSGPDSPLLAEDDRTRSGQPAATKES